MRLGVPSRRVMGGLLLGLTLILPVSGCAGDDDRPLTPEVKAAALVLADKVDKTLVTAEYQAIAACMAGHGFRYPAGDTEQAQHTYLTTMDTARQADFWNTLRQPGSPMTGVDFPDGTSIRLTTKGCEAEGRAQIYGSVQAYLRITTFPGALASAAPDIASIPAVRTALAIYSDCLSAAGYQASSPREARERYGAGVADGECQRQSRIQEELKSAMVDKAAAWIRSANPDIRQLAETRLAAARRVAGIG